MNKRLVLAMCLGAGALALVGVAAVTPDDSTSVAAGPSSTATVPAPATTSPEVAISAAGPIERPTEPPTTLPPVTLPTPYVFAGSSGETSKQYVEPGDYEANLELGPCQFPLGPNLFIGDWDIRSMPNESGMTYLNNVDGGDAYAKGYGECSWVLTLTKID